jgi:hypothetical protein
MYDHIITTANTRKISPGGVILTSKETGEILSRQTVLVAGPNANVSAGEEIELFVDRFPKKNKGARQIGSVSDIGPDNYEIIPPIEIIDKKPYLFISSREVKYVYVNIDELEEIKELEQEYNTITGNTTTTLDVNVKPC